jgi:hypothetical protein
VVGGPGGGRGAQPEGMDLMLRVRSTWSGIGGTPYLSTFFFAGSDETAASAASTAVIDFWNDAIGYVSPSLTVVTLDEIDVIDEATGDLLAVLNIPGSSAGGDASGDILPHETQGLIRINTGYIVGGRKIHGRLFLPGPCEEHNDGGYPSAAYKLNWANSVSDHLLPGAWGVWSRKNGAFYGASGATVWANWAGLRSRRD